MNSANPDMHMTFKIGTVLDNIFRFLLGGIFIWASWSKISDPGGFAIIVQNYQILPEVLVGPFAVILPWLELICGIFLITGFMINGSIVLIDMMLLIFIVSFMANVFRGIDVSCGCFSTEIKMTGSMFVYLMRDLAMLAIGIWILYFRFQKEKAVYTNA